MGLIKEFREFALKGNVIDLAVGVIIGAAFGAVVSSLVTDVMMPPIGGALAGVDFSNLSLELPFQEVKDGKEIPVVIKYGAFINATIKFLITAFAVFLLIKGINTARKRFEKEQAAAPAAPAADVVLLTEIRDLLKQNR